MGLKAQYSFNVKNVRPGPPSYKPLTCFDTLVMLSTKTTISDSTPASYSSLKFG